MARTIQLSSKSNKKDTSRLSIANKNKKKLLERNSSNRKLNSATRKIARIGLILTTIVLVLMLGGSVYAFNLLRQISAQTPSLDNIFVNPPTPSIIYDRHGKELHKVIGDVNTDPVDIDRIPDQVTWAFLAAEDMDFYNHTGFDTSGIIRCGVVNLRGGDALCGASTITQQLIKMTALKDEDNKVVRKIKELFMSTNVEQQNNKREILQMYLTVAPFGGNIIGIDTASNYYFRKEPKDLTLAEATILASIIQNPAYLSPTNPYDGDTDRAKERVKSRQLYVLGQIESKIDKINTDMIAQARIQAQRKGEEYDESKVALFTKELVEEAREQELDYKRPVATTKLAGNFVDYAVQELQRKGYKNGDQPFTVTDLQTGGYKIYTTLDYEMQRHAEASVAKGGNDYKFANVYNSAVMTMIPGTGEIITMAGSKSFEMESEGCDGNGQNCKFNPQVNVLTSRRSPGSTNKPLAYYKAIEQGLIYPGSMMPDVPITIGSYEPKNWNGQFNGVERTAVQNLRDSLNIPALTVAEMIGVKAYAEEAEKWGYTTYRKDDNGNFPDIGHSVVLGGTDIIPVEHAAGFGVFANQGDYVAAQPILKIEDREGKIIFEHKAERKQVASPQATHILNRMLFSLDDFPSWDGRDVSAKTGTSEENKDSWLAIYSPDFVTIAWSGNNNSEPTQGWASTVLTPWLAEYHRAIGDSEYLKARTPFSRPGFITSGGGSCNDKGECLGLQADLMIEGLVPSTFERKEVKIKVCKDQQDRKARPVDEALGFAEEKTFYQYTMLAPAWQGFLDKYLEEKGKDAGGNPAPTKDCDKNRGDTGTPGPIVNLTKPTNNSHISGTSIEIKGSIATTSGTVSSVEVYLGTTLLGNITGNLINFTKTFDVSAIAPGAYILEVKAMDNNGGVTSKQIPIVIGNFPSAINVSYSPALPATASVSTAIPITVVIPAGNPLTQVKIKIIKSGATDLGGVMTASGGSNYSFSWTPSEVGTYDISIEATNLAGQPVTVTGDIHSIVIN